jgi:hypothetical protein
MGTIDGVNEFPGPTAAAKGVIERHFAALNAGDEAALTATLHFPHYRLASGRMQVWERADGYLAGFHARAGDGWHHSTLDICDVIASSPDKVHFDIEFTRYRADGTVLGRYRSIWVIARIGGRWAAQLRSSFAD